MKRDRLRDLLSGAAQEGKLAFDDGARHDVFVEGSSWSAPSDLHDDTSGDEDAMNVSTVAQ